MERSAKTFVVAVATVIAALALSATAVAALSAPAPETSGWTTTLATRGRSALGPGATDQIPFVVTNSGHDTRALNDVAAAVAAAPTGDAETAAGADIHGCLAAWFTVSVDEGNRALPPQVTPGASYGGWVDLTMRDSGTDQDACWGAAPAVSVIAR